LWFTRKRSAAPRTCTPGKLGEESARMLGWDMPAGGGVKGDCFSMSFSEGGEPLKTQDLRKTGRVLWGDLLKKVRFERLSLLKMRIGLGELAGVG